MQMSKTTKVALGIVAVVIVAGLVLNKTMTKKAPSTEIPPVPQEEVVATPKSQGKNTSVTPPVTPIETRSYAELILAYRNKTLQFGASCQMPISNYVYKMGTEVLLDNRTNTPIAIKLAGASYDLGAYGYKVAALSTEGTFMVSCGENKNVATVAVQK